MFENVDLNSITDGNLYNRSDIVNISCNNCDGCSDCCKTVGETITLDPYDIYNLSKALKKSFVDMMEKEIEIRDIDGVILPNILISEETGACSMLDSNGRCTIHKSRPGYCRLYPLGRLYNDEGDFNYIFQVNECPYPQKGPVRISDWLGITELEKYEEYIKRWHALCRNLGNYALTTDDKDAAKRAAWAPIRIFYERPYNTNQDFYTQFYERLSSLYPAK